MNMVTSKNTHLDVGPSSREWGTQRHFYIDFNITFSTVSAFHPISGYGASANIMVYFFFFLGLSCWTREAGDSSSSTIQKFNKKQINDNEYKMFCNNSHTWRVNSTPKSVSKSAVSSLSVPGMNCGSRYKFFLRYLWGKGKTHSVSDYSNSLDPAMRWDGWNKDLLGGICGNGIPWRMPFLNDVWLILQ